MLCCRGRRLRRPASEESVIPSGVPGGNDGAAERILSVFASLLQMRSARKLYSNYPSRVWRQTFCHCEHRRCVAIRTPNTPSWEGDVPEGQGVGREPTSVSPYGLPPSPGRRYRGTDSSLPKVVQNDREKNGFPRSRCSLGMTDRCYSVGAGAFDGPQAKNPPLAEQDRSE